VTCPLCESAQRPRVEMRLLEADLVRCTRCGLVRVALMPTAASAARLYADGYFRDPRRGYVDYVADERVFRAEFRRRLRVLRSAGARGRLLDVGCASGALLVEARAGGFDPVGLEPAPAMARRAAESSGCPVLAVPLQDALLAPAAYDVVTMFDVLEHVVAPVRALEALRRALAPGGTLAVTVPDYGGMWARASGRTWPFLTPWEHLVYFTRRTLRASLATAGFERVRFHAARTPVSFGTLAAKSGLPRALVPPFLRHRGVGLPAGTLFATALVPRPV